MSTLATLPERRIRTGRVTFEEFYDRIREDQKADLLNGVIYMASPESYDDNRLGGWLYRLMDEFAEETNQGEVVITRVAFRISGKHGPEPDVAFVATEHLDRVHKGYVDGPPDIAVEIVSPDSVDRDYVQKRTIYERAGVCEYWIIDPDEQRATFLRLHRGKYREVPLDGTTFTSQVLKGFAVDPRWFWSKRRPAARKVLEKLLRGGK
jgi:Uma2 family endonuclease